MTPPPTGPIFTMALTLSNGQSLQDAFVAKTTLGAKKTQIIADEYRRFLHLAATGQGAAVPSQVVDFMWHLHLEDTRTYQTLYDEAFGRFVHHTPGRAPQAQGPAYAQTLERYEQVFGTAPDRRVWPSMTDLARSRLYSGAMLSGFALVFFGMLVGQIGADALAMAVLPIGGCLAVGGVLAAPLLDPSWRIDGANGSGCGGD